MFTLHFRINFVVEICGHCLKKLIVWCKNTFTAPRSNFLMLSFNVRSKTCGCTCCWQPLSTFRSNSFLHQLAPDSALHGTKFTLKKLSRTKSYLLLWLFRYFRLFLPKNEQNIIRLYFGYLSSFFTPALTMKTIKFKLLTGNEFPTKYHHSLN